MKQELKNGLSADIHLVGRSRDEKHFFVLAVADKKQVGYCCFDIVGDECKILRIAVTNKDFLSKGVGNAMFKTMENFAYNNGAKYVSGIFVARGYRDISEKTSKFYISQGFVPEDDESFCEREELFKIIKSAHPQFDAPVTYDQNLYDKISKYNFEENDIFSSQKSNTKCEPEIDL